MAVLNVLEDSPTQWTTTKEEGLKDALQDGTAGINTSEVQIAGTDIASATQTLTNKTINADNNTISNLAIGAEVSGTATSDIAMGDNNITGIGRASFTQELDNGSKTASFSVDFGTDLFQKVTLTANTMTLTLDTTFGSVVRGQLKIVNGGLATLTWATESGSLFWVGGSAPTLTSSGTDIVTCYFDGTDWYLGASLDFS